MKAILKSAILSCVIALPMPALAEYSISTLDSNDAQSMINLGTTAAIETKANICVAIVDPSGMLIAFQRMDRAPLSCIDAAIAKAKSAALYKIKTSVNMDRVNSAEPAIATLPNLVPVGGGVPVLNNDVVVGAVGVSGAIRNVEIQIAEKIANSYTKSLAQAHNN
ncbi:heme-binding protein [Bartonella sp. HY329]|uniref:GlcG/HbpS family heme-binding protein n=1 Tax=unclassified Bartonella TaxID=2645622 RepID=UPI0021C60680|nr:MULTISPECIES: heme-binding protein [unclassified Bartonella]UXM93888.1 heme-binding protein [Bartonella sp. HY329]UXN08209.1 heme-binding protein [Bartonella sp. HY328]